MGLTQSNQVGKSGAYENVVYGKAKKLKRLNKIDYDGLHGHNASGRTLVHIAAERGQLDCVKTLAKLKVDVNEVSVSGQSAVFVAASNGQAGAIEVLHSLGADLDKADKHGRSPLYIAATNDWQSCVRVLHKLGAKVETSRVGQRTAVWAAAYKGHIDMVNLLHSLGADINKADIEGVSPVHVAASLGNVDMVLLLHTLGADLQSTNKKGVSVEQAAQKGGFSECADVVRELLSAEVMGSLLAAVNMRIGHETMCADMIHTVVDNCIEGCDTCKEVVYQCMDMALQLSTIDIDDGTDNEAEDRSRDWNTECLDALEDIVQRIIESQYVQQEEEESTAVDESDKYLFDGSSRSPRSSGGNNFFKSNPLRYGNSSSNSTNMFKMPTLRSVRLDEQLAKDRRNSTVLTSTATAASENSVVYDKDRLLKKTIFVHRNAEGEMVEVEDEDGGESNTHSDEPLSFELVYYPLKHLQQKNRDKDYDGLLKCQLEKHMLSDEFKRTFGLDIENFYALPKWKQINMKKRHGVF